jgi:hypothetical protein
MPPAPSLCLPEELTEFEVGKQVVAGGNIGIEAAACLVVTTARNPHTGYVQGTDVRPARARETANVTTDVNHSSTAPPYRQTNPVWRDVGG